MAKNPDQPDQPDQPAGEGDGTSPLLESIDPRQAEANNLTSTPDDTDARDQSAPDPKDNPAAPNDVSNVVDPSDPATLTGHDAQPGENGQQPVAYATLAELKAYVSVPSADTVDDTGLQLALDAASIQVERFCDRYFTADSTPTTRIYAAKDWRVVAVDPISTLTGLVVATDDNDDGVFETTWTIGTDFQVEPTNAAAFGWPWTRLVSLGRRWWPRWNLYRPGVSVTARFGWPGGVAPAPVKQATLLQASRLWKRKDAPFGVAGSVEFGSEVRLLAKLDPDVELLLRPFRRSWWVAGQVPIDVNATMDALGVRLATISGLRVFDYPADSITPPAAVVGLPELVVFDETYRRGMDAATFDVHVLVSKVSDRAARDAISAYLTSVKAAVDGNLGGVVADARVAEARSNTITVGGVEYLAVSFTVEVRG